MLCRTDKMKIPFHVPVYDEHDAAALAQVIASGSLVGESPEKRGAATIVAGAAAVCLA